jgi:hypothetical protein
LGSLIQRIILARNQILTLNFNRQSSLNNKPHRKGVALSGPSGMMPKAAKESDVCAACKVVVTEWKTDASGIGSQLGEVCAKFFENESDNYVNCVFLAAVFQDSLKNEQPEEVCRILTFC